MTNPPLPPLSSQATAQLLAILVRLREALENANLPLALPDVELARKARTELVDQLEDYLLPRLIQIDAPLLTVVGGSTGAGKSTLVNSLVGARVTQPGVLRPTTRSPVLVFNPADAEWFEEARILPDLQRTRQASADPGTLQLVRSEAIPRGLAVLDAPDIDSVEEQNRTLAAQLLGAADLWLFVTSASRYADQVPWEYLKQAADRSAAVAIVLDRTELGAVNEVSTHLARMLSARGLRDSPLFVVPEGEVDEHGLLPSHTVREIRAWLSSLAADADARQGVVRQTLEGAIRTLAPRTYSVADACHDQVEISARFRRDAETAYETALNEIDHACVDGTLLRGEVLASWQEFIGTGELLKMLDSKVSRLRDRVTGAAKGAPHQATRPVAAMEAALVALVLEHCEAAAERADASWREINAGRVLLDATPDDLSRASLELRSRAETMIRDWQESVLELVREEARSSSRVHAAGLPGLAVALMVTVIASGDAVNASAPAAESAQVGEKILEAVLGDHAVRRLVAQARDDLVHRMLLLAESEQRRFGDLVAGLGISLTAEEALRTGARNVDDVRFASHLS